MKKQVAVSQYLCNQLQGILDIKEGGCPDCGPNEVIHTLTAHFGGGIEADIKVCNGDSPYVDPVLFENGSELLALDVTDTLLGSYRFVLDQQEYIVEVILE